MAKVQKALPFGVIFTALGVALAAEPQTPEPIQLERQQAFNTSDYTPIGPAQFGFNGALSFVRFVNRSGATATFTIRAVGSPSGEDYMNGRTYDVSVPNHASPQYPVTDLRANISSAVGADISPHGSDTAVILYVKTDQVGKDVGFQHVTYNSSTGFFENVSVCTYNASTDYSVENRALVNVHTSQLASYPSTIEIINPNAIPRNLRGTVYDARTGASIGVVSLTAPANARFSADFTTLERDLRFSPAAGQAHVNIEFDTADSSPYSGITQHKVRQTSSGAVFNLTTICPIEPRSAASGCPPSTPSNSTSNPSSVTPSNPSSSGGSTCS